MGSSSTRYARGYAGPERRRNQVLVTRNTEYHCHDGSCVAVRDRRTGAFESDHPAIGKRMMGGMLVNERGIVELSPPEGIFAGEKLFFSSCNGDLEHDIVTSPLQTVERPRKDVAVRYQQARWH